ncbi:MAG TPA: two-component regulator propeller domain-containing protein, partial [Rhodothermales bacterium]|nr:two-component regulator propeller domain-containing protein [Rhodothermales bacterium]
MRRALPLRARAAAVAAVALLLAVLPAGGAVRAQSFAPPFHRLTVDGGLPHNAVAAVVQDQQGFVWVGTADGLARFDGYSPEPFLYAPGGGGSVSGNHVAALLLGRDGALWVGTTAGLDRFDAVRRRFVPYLRPSSGARRPVAALAEDTHGRLWVGHADGAGGLTRLDAGGARAVRMPVGQFPVSALAAAPDGSVWAGGREGLVRFRADGRRTALAPEVDGVDVRALLTDSDGSVWVGTGGAGLIRLDARGALTDRFVPGGAVSGLPSPFVTGLARGSDGAIWVTTAGPTPTADGALCRFVFKAFECVAHDRDDATSLPPGGATVAFQDRNDVLWVGTEGGLAWTDLESRLVPHFTHDPTRPNGLVGAIVTAFLEADKSTLWVGTRNGLDRFDRQESVFIHYRRGPNTPYDDVRALADAGSGRLWVGTAAGLDLFDPATGRFTPHPAADAPRRDVRTVTVGPGGVLWVGTGNGLFRLEGTRAVRYRPLPRDRASLPDARITAVLPDPDTPTQFWVGTEGGLARLDTRTGRALRFPAAPGDSTRLADNAVTALAVRPGERGAVWVGTEDGALARLDTRTGRVARFGPPAGFPGRTVFGLVADSDGALWASAREGLVHLSPAHLDAPARANGGHVHTESCYHVYDLGRGVQSRQFSPNAAYRTSLGELAFGGINGFNFFAPSDLRDNTHAPTVMVTGLRVGGRPVAAGPGRPVALPFPFARSVQLPHQFNDLAFSFVALHHGRPGDNRYEVMLENFDRGWLALGAQRSVAYANVPPGAYTLRVRAANGDGQWTPVGLSLPVVIAPPWWATWWARTLGLLLAIGIVVGSFQWRTRSVHEQNRRLTRAVAERTAELEAQKAAADRQAALLAEKNGELEATLDQLHTAQTQLVHAEKLAGLGRLTA